MKEQVEYKQGKMNGCYYKWFEDGNCNGQQNGWGANYVEYYENGEVMYQEGRTKCPCKTVIKNKNR
jgi:antitoxin component YwqK of YwqJK toxin-antitoxin module